ncbi:hypothetical protein GUJ93_ZPchr0001g31449 [Zizania palustris]|uniref:Uncharacterized protein n=1 Tax=Zizania palustris TaxID=103762 RepID=A0A8J5VSW1_ZIZPA|nr:hypothetical protein GUJ93_ZPchr0001g31449 [Zizania palustris]
MAKEVVGGRWTDGGIDGDGFEGGVVSTGDHLVGWRWNKVGGDSGFGSISRAGVGDGMGVGGDDGFEGGTDARGGLGDCCKDILGGAKEEPRRSSYWR